jgi:hypothetical protein
MPNFLGHTREVSKTTKEQVMRVRIGRVRTNSGLVVHLSIGGDPCACGYKVNAEISRVGTKTRFCKRGFTAARITAAQQANNYAASRWSPTAATILAEIIESRRTPAERAASAAKFAQTQWAQDIAAAAAAPPYRHRTFAEIRAALLGTTTDVHPDQLALLPAAA